MSTKLRSKKKLPKPKQFIVLNQDAEVWVGLLGGRPVFSPNIDEAKQLEHVDQFDMLQQVSPIKLERLYL
jgi:hypothetical protein